MKVLVTGATGFIGSYVVNELLQRGITVIATSLNKEKAQQKDWFLKTHYHPFDISKFAKANNLFEYFYEPDCIIHLAWEGLPHYKSEHHLAENLPLHKPFLKQLIEGGAKNINITGTCFEYGMQEGCLSEDMPALPDNNYAIAKNELRIFIEELQQQFSFSFKWLRLFYMYGKGQAANSLIPQLEAALQRGDEIFNMSGGEQVRDFLRVEQVAKYIVDVSLQTAVTGIINICSNRPVTVKELVLNYLKEKNSSIKLNPGYYPYPDFEPMKFWGSNSRLIAALKQTG
ncbi:MAG: NAD(P)-dependent oxidoreductase [Niabella sp.]